MRAVVLLSGGADSCVALFKVGHNRESYLYDHIDALFFDYGQDALVAERAAVLGVWKQYKLSFQDPPGALHEVKLSPSMFFSSSSILGRSQIDQYADVAEAVAMTPTDRSYVPFRNGIFLSVAAHFMAAKLEGDTTSSTTVSSRLVPRYVDMNRKHAMRDAGDIVIGARGRTDPDAPPGFPDCSNEFMAKMHDAITVGTGKRIGVLDILNHIAPTRERTLRVAQDLPGCWAALSQTVSCFHGDPPCGRCLPCQRRAQAFAALGQADPALEAPHAR